MLLLLGVDKVTWSAVTLSLSTSTSRAVAGK